MSDSLRATCPTATETAARVRAGEVTAAETVERSLARIAEVDPSLHAFTQVHADEARAAARAVDALPLHERGPLAGVPIAVKAEIDVAGHVTTYGGRGNTTPASADSEIVRRLRAAGAVVVGTTALPEFGQFPFTESADRGVTHNPWSYDHSPGGSSGGSAVAVASGCVPVGIGTDGGGSIRIPASCCGLVGLKPARGRVSTAPHPSEWGALGTAGPITRTVDDTALLYDVLHGSTSVDRWSAPAPERSYVTHLDDTTPRSIALVTAPALGPVRVDRDVVRATYELADRLTAAGHAVTEVDGRWPDVQASFVPQFFAAIRECTTLVEHPDRLEHRTRTTARMGTWARRPVVTQARRQGKRLRESFVQRFTGFDAVLSPTLACTPPRVGRLDGTGSVHSLLRSLPMIAFTTLANVTGLPAVSVPAGTSRDGLPIGAQLSGLTDDEGVLVSVAATIDS